MTKNPFINALVASGYIALVASGLFLTSHYVRPEDLNIPEIVFPIFVLSLLVFSVALMAFTFFYQPVLLFLDNKKDEATSLFLKTLGIFAVITIILLIVVGGLASI